jgi:hypothetical protein
MLEPLEPFVKKTHAQNGPVLNQILRFFISKGSNVKNGSNLQKNVFDQFRKSDF